MSVKSPSAPTRPFHALGLDLRAHGSNLYSPSQIGIRKEKDV